MAMDELKGNELGEQTITIERAPVPVFAKSIGEDPLAFASVGDLAPPTYPFVMAYWGTLSGEFAGLPIRDLRKRGMILHGEQEFVYRSPMTVGQTLIGTRKISDVYEKETSSSVMEFYVMETAWRDADSGEPVVDDKFTLIIRAKKG